MAAVKAAPRPKYVLQSTFCVSEFEFEEFEEFEDVEDVDEEGGKSVANK